jgi:hypothetical protein
MPLQRNGSVLCASESSLSGGQESCHDVFRQQPEILEMLSGVQMIARSPDGYITLWTAADEHLYGWSAAEAIGHSYDDLLDPELPEPRHRIEEQALAAGHWDGMVVHHARDGRRIAVFVRLTPSLAPDGTLRAFVEMSQPGSSAQASESHESGSAFQNFAHLSASFQTLIEASPVAIAALDSENRVEIWNPAAERLFGLGADEVYGRKLVDLPLCWSAPEAMESLLRSMTSRHLLLRVCPSGDCTHPLDINFWCAPFTGRSAGSGGHVLLALDETEKKFLEQALLGAGEREQRRIGQELHDHLCQQLLGAAFSAQALSRDLRRDGAPQAERAEGLARLINDAVLQARNMARGINPVETDSAGLMSALQELAERAPEGAHIELRCERPVLINDAEVGLHAFRIAQEAVTNALRHANANRILIRLSRLGDHVTLQVSDNGAGMDDHPDSGVGMGIMKYRAQAIRGDLVVDTGTGAGTTITCSFPNLD